MFAEGDLFLSSKAYHIIEEFQVSNLSLCAHVPHRTAW